MYSFFEHLFDTKGFVRRWICGQWSEGLGWMHVVSDVAIFGAYAAIPLMLAFFLRKRKDVPLSPIFWLFAVFIFSCGFTHLIEATLFWQPWYRFSALFKVLTAIVSWLTVFALFKAIPVGLGLPGLVKVNQDLNEEVAARKHTEAALRMSETSLRKKTEELETLLDALPACVWQTMDADCAVITGNRAANELTGTPPGGNVSQAPAAVGNKVPILQLKADGSAYQFHELPLPRAIATKKPVQDALLDVRFSDGRSVKILGNAVPLFDEHGEPRGGVSAFLDVTALKQAEARLNANEEKLRAVVDSIAQLAWTARADGYIYWYNRRWYEYTGTTPEEMEGWGWQSVHHPERLATVVQLWEASIATGRAFEMVFPLRNAQGEYRLFLTRALPLKDSAGQVTTWFGTNTDIDDLKQVENALREAKVAAEEANISKDCFLAMLSHELRTPLTPILMVAAMLEQDETLPLEVREDMEMIKRNLKLETKLIDDLLDVSRAKMGKLVLDKTRVDLHAAVRDACQMCQQEVAAKNLQLFCQLTEEAVWISADPERLQQIFWNVLRNAVKFTPEGGTIRLSTALNASGSCEFRVEDFGIGIAPEVLPHIFTAFEQGQALITQQYGGLGLGLAICRALVELHGGNIRAESAGLGCGATFIVELPTLG